MLESRKLESKIRYKRAFGVVEKNERCGNDIGYVSWYFSSAMHSNQRGGVERMSSSFLLSLGHLRQVKVCTTRIRTLVRLILFKIQYYKHFRVTAKGVPQSSNPICTTSSPQQLYNDFSDQKFPPNCQQKFNAEIRL